MYFGSPSSDEDSTTSTESSTDSSAQCFESSGRNSQVQTPKISFDWVKPVFPTSKDDFKLSNSLEEIGIPEELNGDIDSYGSFPEEFNGERDSYRQVPEKFNGDIDSIGSFLEDSYGSEISDRYFENKGSSPSLSKSWESLDGSSKSSSGSSKSSRSSKRSSSDSSNPSSESMSESFGSDSSFSICSYSSFDSESDSEDSTLLQHAYDSEPDPQDSTSLQHSIISYLTGAAGDSDISDSIHWGTIFLSSSDSEDGSFDAKPDYADFLEQEKDIRRMEICQNGYKHLVHLVMASLAHDTSAKVEHQNWRCLIVDGIPEKNITTEEECKQFAVYLFDKLNAPVKPSDIVRAYRLGPKGANNVKMRPILLKFRHYEDKSLVFKKSHALGVGFRISVKEPQIDFLVNLIKGLFFQLEPSGVKIMKSVKGFYQIQVKGDGKLTPDKLCKVTSLSDLQKLNDYLVVKKKKKTKKNL